MNIYQLMAQAAAQVGHVAKGDRNSAQGFNFRGIDAVVNACGPVFRENGIVVFPTVLDAQYEQATVGHKQTAVMQVRLKVAYTFTAPDGTFFTATVCSESMDTGDKATAKAMSVAFRTCLLQTLCLPTDEPDPDSYSYERSEGKPMVKPKAEPGEVKRPAKAAVPQAGGGLSKSQQIWVLKQAGKFSDKGAMAAVSGIIGREVDTLESITADEARVLLPALSDMIAANNDD